MQVRESQKRMKQQILKSDRNESISDIINCYFNHETKLSPLNDEQMKHGAEEPDLLLHNIMIIILYKWGKQPLC